MEPTSNQMFDISLIIPHYNSVEMLIKLIHTIPEKKEIQILVVDDNSSDSLDELKEFIKSQEQRSITLLTNDTGVKGAGSSRNVGLKHATGKWLLFADSDDYFMDGWYSNLEKYLDSDWDMVYFEPTSIDLSTNKVSSRHVMYAELVQNYHKKGTKKALLEMKYCFCTPWSKLIRREIVEKNNITFDQVLASNDIMFMTKTAFHSEKVTTDLSVLYCVTRGGKSLTSEKNKKKFMSRIDVFVNRYCYLRENLSKKDFHAVHMDRYALGKLVDCVLDKWGIKMFFEISGIFLKNRIAIWDWGLFNPVTLIHKAKIELTWWWDIKRNR